MTPKQRLGAIAAATAIMTTVLFAATNLKSQWRTDTMKVDGSLTDWPVLTALTKEVNIGAANNDRVLHLVITTGDAALRQRLLLTGLIIYLDPTNKKQTTAGIRVPPLGGDPSGRGAPRTEPRVTYVEAMGPEKNARQSIELASSSGVEAAVGNHEGVFVLELLVPLQTGEGRTYGVGLKAETKTIGIGVVTPDLPTPAGRGGEGRPGGGGMPGGGGGMPGGGMPGRGGGGGRGGPGGDMSGARGGETGKALKSWITLDLASVR